MNMWLTMLTEIQNQQSCVGDIFIKKKVSIHAPNLKALWPPLFKYHAPCMLSIMTFLIDVQANNEEECDNLEKRKEFDLYVDWSKYDEPPSTLINLLAPL